MRKVLFLILSVCFLQGVAGAADGDPDTGFGFGGTVIANFGAFESLMDLATQPDGKIVAAGVSCVPPIPVCSFALTRYNSNGSVDQTFGSGGMVTAPAGASQFAAMALQTDGKIVVAGGNGGDSSDFILVRYNSN